LKDDGQAAPGLCTLRDGRQFGLPGQPERGLKPLIGAGRKAVVVLAGSAGGSSPPFE